MEPSKKKPTQVLNFLWINLDLPPKPDPEDGSIRQPLPPEYIENVREAGIQHPDADIDFWFDSKRLTEKQWSYLKTMLEDSMTNVHLKDLRSIPEYDKEELYNRPETNPYWRSGYDSVIWLQIDAAKILISLQGNYDQHFFADLDHAHLDIESKTVQTMLKKNGLMIGSAGANYVSIENQLWGFNRSRNGFFKRYYKAALKESYKGNLGYDELIKRTGPLKIRRWSVLPVYKDKYCLPIGSKGMAHAQQPGHEWDGKSYWSHGNDDADKKKPAVISAWLLKEIFKAVSEGRPVPRKEPSTDLVPLKDWQKATALFQPPAPGKPARKQSRSSRGLPAGA